MIQVNSRTHHVPTSQIVRNGCPCKMTPFYQTAERPPGDETDLLRQYTTMRLVHHAKDGSIKYAHSLRHIHDDLANTSIVLRGSGSSNILNSSMSIECKITLSNKEIIRVRIPISIKIEGTNTKDESVLSYELLEKAYGGKAYLYAALKHLHRFGFRISQNNKHGHCPDYNHTSSKHDQYIRHTEQLLVAYLVLPQSAKILFDQLHGRIRAQYHDATSVKVYNLALHMDSTKTCCGPCEYVLLALMNDYNGFYFTDESPDVHRSFLYHFKQAAMMTRETLPFTFPNKSCFRLFVTVTACEADADHKQQPTYNVTVLQDASVPNYDIPVKSKLFSMTIYTTIVNQQSDDRKLPDETNLSDKTIGISGSKKTKGSPGTIEAVKNARKNELEAENILHRFENLDI